jgi:hypothetical protein
MWGQSTTMFLLRKCLNADLRYLKGDLRAKVFLAGEGLVKTPGDEGTLQRRLK